MQVYFDDFLKQFESVLEALVSEFKEWEDETIELLLQRANHELSELDSCKLHAYKNFNFKECFISTPLEFCNMASVLNDEIPMTNVMETIDPAHVAWAVEVFEHFDSNNDIAITDEVFEYIKACFHDAGMTKLPESLSIFETEGAEPSEHSHDDEVRLRAYVAAKRKMAGWDDREEIEIEVAN